MIPSHDGVKHNFEALRHTLADRAELAYHLRDSQGTPDVSKAYAAGEAHAYGIAEEDVRTAERRSDQRSDP